MNDLVDPDSGITYEVKESLLWLAEEQRDIEEIVERFNPDARLLEIIENQANLKEMIGVLHEFPNSLHFTDPNVAFFVLWAAQYYQVSVSTVILSQDLRFQTRPIGDSGLPQEAASSINFLRVLRDLNDELWVSGYDATEEDVRACSIIKSWVIHEVHRYHGSGLFWALSPIQELFDYLMFEDLWAIVEHSSPSTAAFLRAAHLHLEGSVNPRRDFRFAYKQLTPGAHAALLVDHPSRTSYVKLWKKYMKIHLDDSEIVKGLL